MDWWPLTSHRFERCYGWAQLARSRRSDRLEWIGHRSVGLDKLIVTFREPKWIRWNGLGIVGEEPEVGRWNGWSHN